MLLSIKVIPNAKKEEVIQESETHYKIKVRAIPEDGKANKAVITLIAKHFGIKKGAVMILKGEKSREKVVEIMDNAS